MKEMDEKYNILAAYYAQHYEEVKAFVAKNLLCADSAEDIVQTVFLKLLASDRMITPVTLPCLVYTVARHLIFDYWRHHKTVEEYEHYLVRRGAPDMYGVESVYGAHEITALLERGIARLSGGQQEVIRMNLFDGKAVSEISSELNMNYKSVENRLGVARKEVRRYIRRMLA